MKKKLEAELISIAHRILKLKNKSELVQLHAEAQKIYEKLTVLLFVEENFAAVKPTIGQAEAYEVLETAFDEKAPEESEEVTSEETPQAATPAPTEKNGEERAAEKKEEEVPEPEEAPAEIEEAPEEVPQPEIKVEETPETTEESAAENPKEEVAEATAEEKKEISAPIAEESTETKASGDSTEPESENPAESTETKPETPGQSVVEEGIQFAEPETSAEIEKIIGDPQAQAEDLFKPAFEWTFEAKADAAKDEPKSGQIAFEDLLGTGYVDPVFVKPEENTPKAPESVFQAVPNAAVFENKIPDFRTSNADVAEKSASLNDRLSKGITVGLNDRIAFVKNLFGNSTEEYNRVLSQLITFNTFEEAREFIDNMVKPDYNNWDGKDEYATRFMEVVEKKFS